MRLHRCYKPDPKQSRNTRPHQSPKSWPGAPTRTTLPGPSISCWKSQADANYRKYGMISRNQSSRILLANSPSWRVNWPLSTSPAMAHFICETACPMHYRMAVAPSKSTIRTVSGPCITIHGRVDMQRIRSNMQSTRGHVSHHSHVDLNNRHDLTIDQGIHSSTWGATSSDKASGRSNTSKPPTPAVVLTMAPPMNISEPSTPP